MKKALLVAGTKDARQIADALVKAGYDVLATVATPLGQEYLAQQAGVRVQMGRLNQQEFEALLQREAPAFVVDASHPYAVEVSRQLAAACAAQEVPLHRYAREETPLPKGVVQVADFEEAMAFLSQQTGNILAATGSKDLHQYTRLPNYQRRVFVRVLPVLESLRICQENGFSASQILALQGPFDTEMNLATLRHCHAKWLVTKNSGTTGGTDTKLAAALELGVGVVVIGRQTAEATSTLADFIKTLPKGENAE